MVFVLDKRKEPLMPCSEKRARLLLERKKAVVHRMAPFTIRLKERVGGETQPVRIKLDPGSRTGSSPPTSCSCRNSPTGAARSGTGSRPGERSEDGDVPPSAIGNPGF